MCTAGSPQDIFPAPGLLQQRPGPEQDSRILSIGKHKGLAYSDVVAQQPEYCAWVLEEATKPPPGKTNQKGAANSAALCDFACYVEASAGVSQWEEQPNVQATPIKAVQLTEEQSRAVERVMSGENILITGAAGTGKSFLLRYIVQELERQHPGQVAVTATTGIAAANIGGQTLHAYAGIGLGWGGANRLAKQIMNKSHAMKRWQAKVLVVDEVSMLDGSLFTKLEDIARQVRRSKKPFGGLQLVLCGDFLQLPPVKDSSSEVETTFCFQTPAWENCGLGQGKVMLKQCVRQAEDKVFADILNEVRLGKLSANTQKILKACHKDVKPPPPEDGIMPTKLYCINKDVDEENNTQLEKLPGKIEELKAEDTWPEEVSDKSQKANMVATMNKRLPKTLQLKVGAQVILIKNRPEAGLVNGSRGTVVAFRFGFPLVRFDNGKLIRVQRETFELKASCGAMLKRDQVPLKLGWALTVHKAAGLTLSRAELNVGRAFEAGQTYVALSRLTGTKGLWITGSGISRKGTRADPDALKFYED